MGSPAAPHHRTRGTPPATAGTVSGWGRSMGVSSGWPALRHPRWATSMCWMAVARPTEQFPRRLPRRTPTAAGRRPRGRHQPARTGRPSMTGPMPIPTTSRDAADHRHLHRAGLTRGRRGHLQCHCVSLKMDAGTATVAQSSATAASIIPARTCLPQSPTPTACRTRRSIRAPGCSGPKPGSTRRSSATRRRRKAAVA